ncbi:MAG: 16S rRNA (adenine(1518)-N(6)/adenine(1519)-N(6))-dimethyltransferase RsmA [Ruminococcaceae bacterium]|nr:16S rRNA (adenine(1518)-N(6)/adenine(1519)-N(6))-dimethyltransferase RsmA [Oscillospiraceae bacterium]
MKYDLSNKRCVEKLLHDAGFTFKKSLGQNFLTDPSVCPEMAFAAADADTGVIEIGPGIGVLTVELAEIAKKVIAVELDERLRPILAKTLEDYPNASVIFSDVLKLDLNKLIEDEFKDCKRVTICANLPYYITSPIIMSLLESKLPVESITVMVQKEAAERLCAKIPSRDVGAVTLAAAFYAEGEMLFGVPRDSFTPAPNVDSAVIQFKIRRSAVAEVRDEKLLFRLIRGAFEHRRKILVNSVSASGVVSKEKLTSALTELDIPLTVRAEQLSLEQFAALADKL